MAFRFGLESVLRHRQRLEDVAQREFAEAQDLVRQILDEIEAMYRRMDEVREEIAQAEREGSAAKLAEVVEMNRFLVGQRKRVEQRRLVARERMAVAEEKQERLIEAAREKKILVKLKERRQLEYRERLRLLEAKELDDLTSTRQAWGKR